MEETDKKELLPIHVILGANEYTRIKMAGYQRTGARPSEGILYSSQGCYQREFRDDENANWL